tara:strand:- start:82 stop:663 length:582 start_codon:yes stop_codon:yes gene_type:complete
MEKIYMKLLMENWRKYLNEEDEEQLEEGWKEKVAGLAAVGALGGMPDMAQADDTFADMFSQELAATKVQADLELSNKVGKNLATKIFNDIKDNLPSNTPIQDGVEITGAQHLELDVNTVNKSFHETMKSSLEKNKLQSGENFGTNNPGDNFGVKVNLMPKRGDSAEDIEALMVQVTLLNKGKVVSTYSFNTQM